MASIGDVQQADGYAAEPRSLHLGAAKSAPLGVMASIGDEQQADGYAAEPRSLYVGAAKSAPQLTQSRDEDV